MEKKKIGQLKKQATLIRKHIIDEVYSAASGHPGGSLSCTDILTVLYFHEMKVDVQKSQMAGQGQVCTVKGHCAPALYGTLAEKVFSL